MVDQRLQRSRAQERRGAALHGGSRNAGSGNTPWRKSDVRVDRDYLIEYKRTDKKSISIKLEDLETNRTNALLEGRKPLFGIEIGGRDWAMVEADELQRLREVEEEFERIRSGCARTELGSGEMPAARPGVVLSRHGESAQEAASAGEGRVSRDRRATRRVSRSRGVS